MPVPDSLILGLLFLLLPVAGIMWFVSFGLLIYWFSRFWRVRRRPNPEENRNRVAAWLLGP